MLWFNERDTIVLVWKRAMTPRLPSNTCGVSVAVGHDF